MVEEALCAPLPPGWAEFYQPKVSCVFFSKMTTGESGWHHPLERHYAATIRRVRMLLAAKLDASDEVSKQVWQARYQLVLSHHYQTLEKILQKESKEQREIRRLRYAKMFRKHANRRADESDMDKQLISRKIIEMLSDNSSKGPATDEPEPEPEPSKGKKRWGLGMMKLKKDASFVQAVAVAEAEKRVKEEEETKAAQVDEQASAKKSKLIKTSSRPHSGVRLLDSHCRLRALVANCINRC